MRFYASLDPAFTGLNAGTKCLDIASAWLARLLCNGGLFDLVVAALGHLVPIDPYDLRHILCALIGIGGIGAAAATAD